MQWWWWCSEGWAGHGRVQRDALPVYCMIAAFWTRKAVYYRGCQMDHIGRQRGAETAGMVAWQS